MTRLWPLARKYAFDALIVAATLAGMLDVALRDDDSGAPRTTAWVVAPAIALVVLPLLWRRRFPFGAPAAVWLWAAAASFVDGRLIVFAVGASVAGMAAAFLLGNLQDATQARVGLLLVLASMAIIVYNDPSHAAADFFFAPALFALGWLAGYVLRVRSAEASAAEERAAQAERERETAARIAVAEERVRIARELHDVVAHAVGVMVLQVGAVRHGLPQGLEEDRDALRRVEEAGRTALGEMRRLLGAMRSDGEDPELAPQPGLGSLQPLLEEIGRAGLPVRLHVDGDPYEVPHAIDLSAYRVVQEGLTNALKHSGASRADVTVRYAADELGVEVRDDGRGASTSDGVGYGLVGIRERVKIYGGEMTVGRASGGGFVLSTRFPLRSERR